MSAFAVVFHRRGGPPESPQLTAMATTLAHRGPDGSHQRSAPPFFLVHQHFWATPEEVGERQPLADAEGRVHLVFDGRLDNREELLRDLGLPGGDGRRLTDAALVLAAYRCWGAELGERLLGPFALVICDLAKRQALCARDPLGDRTLFYRLCDESLIVASEEQALLVHPEVSDELDQARLAHFFAAEVPPDGSTFFKQIGELPPGQVLQVGEASVERRSLWRPEELPALAWGAESELAELYREVLSESVRCRLRSTGPPAVMMSGGIDSTSLAALAAEELRDTGSDRPVHAVSWVFDELESCDERRFIEPVVSRWGLEALPVRGDDALPSPEDPDLLINPSTPEENPYRRLKTRAYLRASEAGSRVVLNGGSANVLYSGSERWFVDLLREGRLREAAGELLRDVRRWGPVGGLRRAGAQRGLRPVKRLLPPGLQRAHRWLTPWARGLVALGREGAPAVPRGLRAEQWQAVAGPRAARGVSVELFHASRLGVELRHPYRDLRLVELMLRLPAHQLYRHGRAKHVAREAMAGRLPRSVLHRTEPTLLTPLFDRGLRQVGRAAVGELLFSKEAVWPRYVRRRWVEQAVLESRSPRLDVVVWNCICFEIWRRRHLRGKLASERPVSYNSAQTERSSS